MFANDEIYFRRTDLAIFYARRIAPGMTAVMRTSCEVRL
jgi:hypothetical protein